MKFLVPARVKHSIVAAGRESLKHDAHGQAGVYRVTSQYYDTLDLRAFWEKMDGVDPRRKFRLRFYGDAGPYFLEIKYRTGQTVFKERLRLREQAARAMLEDGIPLEALQHHLLYETLGEREILVNFLSASCRDALLPINVITYQREAWVGAVERRLRVTFDHFCAVLLPGDDGPAAEGGGTPLVPPTLLVMEVKFTRGLPVWLRDILVSQGLSPIRFSKYATGLEVLARRDESARLGRVRLLQNSQEEGTAERLSTRP